MSGEITRRTIRSRLDCKVEHPEDRHDFKHPELKEWVRRNRPSLIHAILVLIRYWQIQGCPAPDVTLGSFEAWSRVVGGILKAAEIPGFLGDRAKLREETDAENGIFRAFVNGWFEKFQRQTVRTSDLFLIAEEIDGFPLGIGSEQSRKTALGKRLREMRNRIFDGHRVTFAGTGRGGVAFFYLADGEEITPPSLPSTPERCGSTLCDGWGSGGGMVGSNSTLHKITATPPREDGSGYGFGGDGGDGGVKTQPLAGKKIEDVFEEVD